MCSSSSSSSNNYNSNKYSNSNYNNSNYSNSNYNSSICISKLSSKLSSRLNSKLSSKPTKFSKFRPSKLNKPNISISIPSTPRSRTRKRAFFPEYRRSMSSSRWSTKSTR